MLLKDLFPSIFFLPIIRPYFVYNLSIDHCDQLPWNTYLSVINNFAASNQENQRTCAGSPQDLTSSILTN
jgi:hypothetical protein